MESSLTLHTERLSLLPFEWTEHALFLEMNRNAFIRKYLWDDELLTAPTAQEILQLNHTYFQERRYGLWKIQLPQTQETIGYAGLWFFFDEPQPQLIYALFEAHTKQGYATEAGSAIITYVFEQLGFTYLLAATDESHEHSQRVAQRLGMSLVEKRIADGKPTMFYRIEASQDSMTTP